MSEQSARDHVLLHLVERNDLVAKAAGPIKQYDNGDYYIDRAGWSAILDLMPALSSGEQAVVAFARELFLSHAVKHVDRPYQRAMIEGLLILVTNCTQSRASMLGEMCDEG